MTVAQTMNPAARNTMWLLALAVLALGGLGAILLTEAGQIINLPRSWVFGYFANRWVISVLLVVATLGLLVLHRRYRTVNRWVAGAYVAAIVVCLFFIHLFAPYVWLRAQQHDAAFISVEAADRLLAPDTDVLVLEINGDARAYPRDWIMVPHIAGDTVGGEEVAMTYCALSNLPQAFTTAPGGADADYRVIAQVNNNLIFTDTNSGELYQQITGRGEYEQGTPRQYPVQRMPWHSFRALYPDGKVYQPRDSALDQMTASLFKTSLTDHYDGNPLFPTLSMRDDRLPTGEPVWGLLVNGEALAVPASHFGEEDALQSTILGGREVLVAWFAEYQTMGAFFAESLLLAETGNAAGSIQIAGTARPEQLPFFIAACDYTLLGEELYAASAYLSHQPVILGGLKGQDFVKMLITIALLIGVILVTLGWGETFLSWFEAV